MEREINYLNSEISKLENKLSRLKNEFDIIIKKINDYSRHLENIKNQRAPVNYHDNHMFMAEFKRLKLDDINSQNDMINNKQYDKLRIKNDITCLERNIIIKKSELSKLENESRNQTPLNAYKSRSSHM